MSKIDEMDNSQIKIELDKVRSEVQYLGEKLDRKRSWRDRLIREAYRRNIMRPIIETRDFGTIVVGSEVVVDE